ncbi:16S rRNA (uracil(1498)-N(3))-methyltransferase [Leptolyngbya sp. 'hensonii']|uniref:16S rRNA (uracil(1498)-N(3))-methyltransferase n=1 Tax=Leptolyngbya sp. 'hensonii' TaxID=1922337 RepID=UPI00094F84AF|nr:16S rRNA (uracil(1498)-N(3))-methyltransferase [Leptolyngbya sp. 'hensonii']OLP16801.1 16S rRNA (uracil(1498)-N(3))-methyltransferase [Leptolyngbya sp. 'hensonii']
MQRLIIAPEQFNPPYVLLTADQQHYLSRVLRLRAGEHFIAVTAQQWWLAELQSGELQARVLEIVPVQHELLVAVTLVSALPKGSGFDEVVRQATELGVAQIIPVLSDRTLLQPSAQKVDRWRRIAQEAAEQAERQVVPIVQDPIPLTHHLQELGHRTSRDQAYFCVARGKIPYLWKSLQSSQMGSSIFVATGPEGGWTEREVAQAIAANYQPVSLGRRILRAVTAPLAALAILAARLESESDPEERELNNLDFFSPHPQPPTPPPLPNLGEGAGG